MATGSSGCSSTSARATSRRTSSCRSSAGSWEGRWRGWRRSSGRCSASSASASRSATRGCGTASASGTSSTSRSRTSCRSASRPASPSASTACSIRSAPTSRWPRPSARRSARSASSTRARRGSRSPSSPGPRRPVTTATQARADGAVGLAPAFAAARARLGVVVLLVALAVVGWWSTVDRMRGMDDGPWTGLGTLGWFLGAWVVMMAAMMFPSVAPTVALYSRMTRERVPFASLFFAVGYLLTWTAVGALAFALAHAVSPILGGPPAWGRGGRWLAGATLIAAAVYELTPLKDVCLGKCRSPLGFLLGAWREGRGGALQMGAKHGAWCAGCCWALMASLFALGVMSIAWMVFVAVLIAAEKTLPWRRVATYGTAGILLALGVLLLAAPDAVPALTMPGDETMSQMGS